MRYDDQRRSVSFDIDTAYPPLQQKKMPRSSPQNILSRGQLGAGILVGLGILVSFIGCEGYTTYDASYEPYWTYRANRLQEYQIANFQGVRTQESHGRQDPEAHVPLVYVMDSIVNAKINHVMERDHWITTVYFRDTETGRVFYLKEFLPLEKDPGEERGITVRAPLPDEVNQFSVFAFCNEHDLWMSEIISL